MKIFILKGEDIHKDKNILYDNIENKDSIFILDNPNIKLYKYIDEFNLNKDLYTMKICKEIKPIDVDYQGKHYSKFSDLLQNLNQEIESTIVVKGDINENNKDAVRSQLSAIVQQFVYLNIPLGKIQVVTEREAKDLEIIKRYEANVTHYEELARNIYDNISAKSFPNNEKLKNDVLASLQKIQRYISESRKTELKVAAVACKKSGKSVVVNSMLECEMAPTSLTLPTPNTCIYRKSNSFFLRYQDKTIEFKTAKEVKDYILPIFKSVQNKKDEGYGIEDMELGFVPKNDTWASLVIYDTPGPNLVGADKHKESAKKAVSETDVAIFLIDYTNHLTQEEFDLLRYIKDVFARDNKYYSLIFDINKIDERFISVGDECLVKNIDYIRERLISESPEFKDSIIFGTSAQTYFNALEITDYPGFEDMENNEMDNIEFEIGQRMSKNRKQLDNEQIQKATFLKHQCENAFELLQQKLTNLQQVKQFSGMPDLLNYVQYVTRNKARNERLNNLMCNIDTEIASIWNNLEFVGLQNQLAENENKEKFDKAKKILEIFKNEVNAIYDSTFPDIVDKAKKKKLDSIALRNGFLEKNANLKNLSEFVRESYIDSEISDQKCLDRAIGFNFRNLYKSGLQVLFANSDMLRKDKKAVHETEISDFACSLINGKFKNIVSDNITLQINNCTDELKNETKLIQNDLVKIVNERQGKLIVAIDNLKSSLKSDCNIDFDIKTPTIDFAFKYQGEAAPEEFSITNINKKVIWSALEKTFNGATPLHEGNAFGGIKNLLAKVGIIDIADVAISVDKNMEVYDQDIKPILIHAVGDSLKKEIAKVKDTLTGLVEKVVNDIIVQMQAACDSGIENAIRASNAIDNTRALAENIERLNEQKQNLVEFKACVEPLQVQWSEIIKTE